MKRLYTGLMCLALLCALLCGCEGMPLQAPETPSYTLEEVPAYSGEPYVVLNGNVPDFPEADRTANSFESYSPGPAGPGGSRCSPGGCSGSWWPRRSTPAGGTSWSGC